MPVLAMVATAAGRQSHDTSTQPPNPVRSVEAYGGRCEHIDFAGADESAHCRDLLTNMQYAQGQSFQFWTQNPMRAISFFGVQMTPGQLTTTLKVEYVTIAEGYPPTGGKRDAVGTCEFGNLTSGPGRVTCQAIAGGLKYGGTYMTDGAPPQT